MRTPFVLTNSLTGKYLLEYSMITYILFLCNRIQIMRPNEEFDDEGFTSYQVELFNTDNKAILVIDGVQYNGSFSMMYD